MRADLYLRLRKPLNSSGAVMTSFLLVSSSIQAMFIGVAIAPGATQLTRIPLSAYSNASVDVICPIAALEHAYPAEDSVMLATVLSVRVKQALHRGTSASE